MADRIGVDLVGRQVCVECDAFLGKPHKDSCSKSGRLVEMGSATEKFTTVEHAEAEEPVLTMNVETVKLILDWLGIPANADEAEEESLEIEKLRQALQEFVEQER